MKADGKPPLPLRIAASLLPADAREEVLGDLLEKWSGEVSQRPRLRRALWAWRQPFAALSARRWHRRDDVLDEARSRSGWPKFSLLDWKLGFRMLIKDPGLSLIGGLALACVIGVGAGLFHVAQQLWAPDLGLEDSDRIVIVDRLDARSGESSPISVEEFIAWREKLTQVVELSVAQFDERTLAATRSTDSASAVGSLRVAEVTASTFPLTRVRALRGRVINEADERSGAPDVIVLGYDAWQELLGADPNIIGRRVQLGHADVTVVGVMPEGFVFLDSEAWVPLRLTELGPDAFVRPLGRLAAKASFESAQAELEIVGGQTAAERDVKIGAIGEASVGDSVRALSTVRVRPLEVVAEVAQNLLVTVFTSLIFILCMAAVCASVATLLFARTARREAEIVVRNALGASRGRIAGQLFVEALVLSLVAAAVGLAGAQWLLDYALSGPLRDSFQLPFWWRNTFGVETLLVTGGLAVLVAALLSVLPALKATGKGVNEALKSRGAQGASRRLGGFWSVIIVAQVAITVFSLPLGVALAGHMWRVSHKSFSIPVERYLTFLLLGPDDELGASAYAELARRLAMEPGFEGITYASARPGLPNAYARFQMEPAGASDSMQTVQMGSDAASVDVHYFETLGLPVIAGRAFEAGDLGASNHPILINESLARSLGERPLGSRLRFLPAQANAEFNGHITGVPGEEPGDWLEVVGVVRNVVAESSTASLRGSEEEGKMIYRPISAASGLPLGSYGWVALKTSNPTAFAPRLRAMVAEVSPEVRLSYVLPLDVALHQVLAEEMFWAFSSEAGVLLCFLLCAAGLSAIMAVAVATRTREVGIRLALGATRSEVLVALFGRAAKQLMLGTAIGSAAYLLLVWGDSGGPVSALGSILTVGFVMTLVGLLACALPAQHALRIHPLDAIRE